MGDRSSCGSRPVGGENMLGQSTKLLRLHNSETGFTVLSSPRLPLTPPESRFINHLLPLACINCFFLAYKCSPVWMWSPAVGLERSRVDIVTQFRSDIVDPYKEKNLSNPTIQPGFKGTRQPTETLIPGDAGIKTATTSLLTSYGLLSRPVVNPDVTGLFWVSSQWGNISCNRQGHWRSASS